VQRLIELAHTGGLDIDVISLRVGRKSRSGKGEQGRKKARKPYGTLREEHRQTGGKNHAGKPLAAGGLSVQPGRPRGRGFPKKA
jgi:hypothetical protein